jgi:glycosyltransferase involved in cell wall biosynthesis
VTLPTQRPNLVGAQRRLLIISETYLPGWRAGGPTRSIANLVDGLGDTYEIYVLTRDHDHTDPGPYPNITPNRWTRVGKGLVYYADDENLSMPAIRRIAREVAPDLVYLNSMLSRLTMKYLAMRRLRQSRAPVLLAPRGEFSAGALGIKAWRKRTYLGAARLVGLFRGVHWHASSQHEANDIQQNLGSGTDVHTVTNPATQPPAEPEPSPPKVPGAATFVVIARVSRMKNLPFLLENLVRVRGDVTLRIIGGRDPGYWPGFDRQLAELPSNINASWDGGVPPSQVNEVLEGTHFFVLPTLGENFGHAIYEAMRVGRPVVISDKTPWKDLSESMAGWDLPLENSRRWVEILQLCIDMDQEEYLSMSKGAHALASQWFDATHLAEEYSAMFEEAARGQK